MPRYDQAEFFFLSEDFDEDKLANAIEINEENNPYRGLNSFDEAHDRFFLVATKRFKLYLNKLKSLPTKASPSPLSGGFWRWQIEFGQGGTVAQTAQRKA